MDDANNYQPPLPPPPPPPPPHSPTPSSPPHPHPPPADMDDVNHCQPPLPSPPPPPPPPPPHSPSPTPSPSPSPSPPLPPHPSSLPHSPSPSPFPPPQTPLRHSSSPSQPPTSPPPPPTPADMSSLEKDANHLQPPHTTPPPPPPPPSQPHTPPDELASSSQQVVAHGQAHMDGGWAWVVMVASFLISAVVDGVGFSVGVLLSSLQKEFDANNQQVSWVSSVLNGTYLLIGPVVSFFINRHGCRKVSLLGCVIAAASFILSTLCPTIELVILVYGLVGGIGLGCLYQPSVVIVGQYFYARRALALGFTACGSGIGAFAFAPLFGLFVQHYSWKGATILAAALVLLCGLACATFKPIHVPEGCIWMGVISAKSSLVTIPSKLYEGVGMGPLTETITARGGMVVEPEHESCDEISATAVSAFGSKSMCKGEGNGLGEGIVVEMASKEKRAAKEEKPGNGNFTEIKEDEEIAVQDVYQQRIPRLTIEEKRNVDPWKHRLATEEGRSIDSWKDNVTSSAGACFSSDSILCCERKTDSVPDLETVPQPRNPDTKDRNTNTISSHTMLQIQTKILQHSDLPNAIPVDQNDMKTLGAASGSFEPNLTEVPQKSHLEPVTYGSSDLTICETSTKVESPCLHHVRRLIWINMCLMKRPSAIMYGLACFLMSVGMYVPTTFLPPVAELLRFSASQGAFLVSTIGIGNVVGRLLTGLIAHYHPRLVLALNYGSLILAGLVTCLLPLLYKYHLMLGYSLLFGSCIGMFVVLQLMVLIQLMGFDHLNLAFGVISMYHGIGTFVGPPLAGFVADTTGNLRNAFYAIGAAFTLAGIICLPLQQISITECRNVKASPASTELRKPVQQDCR